MNLFCTPFRVGAFVLLWYVAFRCRAVMVGIDVRVRVIGGLLRIVEVLVRVVAVLVRVVMVLIRVIGVLVRMVALLVLVVVA